MTGQGDPYAENGILGPWSAFSAGLLGNMVLGSNADKGKKARKKPKDKPKRPLSAYNVFFKEERTRILQELPEQSEEDNKEGGDTTEEGSKPEEEGSNKNKKRAHGKIGFESLAKVIGKRWKDLPEDKSKYYKEKANKDMVRYKKEMEAYVANGNKKVDMPHSSLNDGQVGPMSKKAKLDDNVFPLETS